MLSAPKVIGVCVFCLAFFALVSLDAAEWIALRGPADAVLTRSRALHGSVCTLLAAIEGKMRADDPDCGPQTRIQGLTDTLDAAERSVQRMLDVKDAMAKTRALLNNALAEKQRQPPPESPQMPDLSDPRSPMPDFVTHVSQDERRTVDVMTEHDHNGCSRWTASGVGCVAGRKYFESMYVWSDKRHEMALISLGERQANRPAPVCRYLTLVRLPSDLGPDYCLAVETAIDTKTQSYAFTYDISDKNMTLGEWARSGEPLPKRTIAVDGRTRDRNFPSDDGLTVDTELATLFSQRQEMIQAFEALLSARGMAEQKELWVSVANEGYTPLFLNWFCSAQAAHADVTKHLVVMATSPELAEELMRAGITAMHHPAFGEYQSAATEAYGAHSFNRMMHLKNVAVWLVLRLQKDVLFLDSDLIWLKDPLPYLRNSQYDATFMGDASTARFSPFYANTGFFYLRSCDKVNTLWQRVVTSMDMIYGSQSQQNPVNLFLAEMHALGLSVQTLSHDFVGGGETLVAPQYRQQVDRLMGRWRPLVLHINWTVNDKDKWDRIRMNGLSYTVERENATALQFTCRVPPPPEDERILKDVEAQQRAAAQ